ncbi:MAG TPA: hypothetical protein VGK56_15560 [Anaerolineales bacterium]
MIHRSDLLHLPYTRDLTEGGIAYALHSLPYTYNRMGGSPYDRLRRIVSGVAVELAFRRHLSEWNIPFDIKGATPFTEPDRYDVALGGRRCDLKSFLITHRRQIAEIKRSPQALLCAPALVPSDQHAGSEHSPHDLYLFAFLPALSAASQHELQKVIAAGQPHYLVHIMPDGWKRPAKWNPLGKLVLKSEAQEAQTLEIGGQDEGRALRSCTVQLPPRTRVEIERGFFSLSYIHTKSMPKARIGIHSPVRRETYTIGVSDWGNIWVYGLGIVLAGYMTREEFSRRANPIQAGSRVFQYDQTQVKNLGVPVSDLRPFSELFERVKAWSLAAA